MKYKTLKRISLICTIVALSLTTLFVACKKTYVEETYSGKVIGMELCNTRTNGYLINLKTPKDIGDTMTIEKKFYDNVVVGYEAPQLLKADQEISGVMYKTKGYANLNCMWIDTRNIQEIILLSVDE